MILSNYARIKAYSFFDQESRDTLNMINITGFKYYNLMETAIPELLKKVHKEKGARIKCINCRVNERNELTKKLLKNLEFEKGDKVETKTYIRRHIGPRGVRNSEEMLREFERVYNWNSDDNKATFAVKYEIWTYWYK